MEGIRAFFSQPKKDAAHAAAPAAPDPAFKAQPSPQLVEQLRRELSPYVDSQLRQGGEEGSTDDCLRCWLTAYKLNVTTAARELTHHAAWRIKHVPNGFITEAEIEQQLAQRKVFLLGTDKYGRAVLLLRAGKHLPSEDLAMVKKFIVYCYDAARRACDPVVNPGRHVVGVLDLSQLEYKNLDFKGLKAMFMIAQHHYPGSLALVAMHEAPMLFYGLWAAVQPFLETSTKQRVQFTYKKDGSDAVLRQLCSPEVLPTDLGGACAYPEPVENVVLRQRQQQAGASSSGGQQQAGGSNPFAGAAS